MSFEHAPVTKGLMIASGLTSFVVGLFDVKHYFHLQLVPHISRHHQYWRLIAHHLAFANSSDLLIAELIFFNVSIHLERQFGSVKFASFAVVSLLVSTILEFGSLLLFHRVGLNYISAGPATLIFSILYQYWRVFPSSYHFRIFGLPLNNKSFLYILVLQLALSRLPGSLAVAMIGILTGQLYRSDLANLKSYRVPPSAVRFARKYLLPLIGSTRAQRRSNRALPDDARYGADTARVENDEVITTTRNRPSLVGADMANDATPDGGGARAGGSVVREWVNELTGRAADPAIRVPSEAEIAQVTLMFPDLRRDVVLGALQRSPNIERAVETLLSSQ